MPIHVLGLLLTESFQQSDLPFIALLPSQLVLLGTVPLLLEGVNLFRLDIVDPQQLLYLLLLTLVPLLNFVDILLEFLLLGSGLLDNIILVDLAILQLYPQGLNLQPLLLLPDVPQPDTHTLLFLLDPLTFLQILLSMIILLILLLNNQFLTILLLL